MAGKKTKSSVQRALCPGCMYDIRRLTANPAKRIDDTLRLHASDGTYYCAQGHSYTIEQLREALEAAQNPPETAAADCPENGGFAVAGEGGVSAPENALNGTVLEGSEEHIPAPDGAGPTVHEVGQIGPINEPLLSIKREIEPDLPGDGSSHPVDELHSHKAALLPNGDMIVPLILPENVVGPVTELAQQDGKTVDEWISDNFLFYIESYFTAPKA